MDMDMRGEKLSIFANMILIYLLVRSASRNGGDEVKGVYLF